MSGLVQFPTTGSIPGTSPVGTLRIYAKSDKMLYVKDDAGVETALGIPASDFLAALEGLSSNGIIIRTGPTSATVRTVQGGTGISVANGTGVSGDPIITNTDLGSTAVATHVGQVDPHPQYIDAGEAAAAAPVQSVFGRTGTVTSVSGDYTAADIGNTPAGNVVATNVQDAIDELDAEKIQDPTTTTGDILYRDSGGDVVRLGVGATDQLLSVAAGIPVWRDETYGQDFGDGSDGNLVLSAPITLTDAMYYNTLTIIAGGSINTAGYPLYCKTLNLSNAPALSIHRNGTVGIGSAATAGGAAGTANASQLLGSGGNGGAGGASSTTVGASGAAGVAVGSANGGSGGIGGLGGTGTGGAGGAAAAGGTASGPTHFGRLEQQFLRGTTVVLAGAGGRGGGAGGGTGAVAGRGGGGGGAGGGVVAIFAETLITTGSTAIGAIQSQGGAGGTSTAIATAGAGGGAGGGGGGGGYIYVTYLNRTGPAVLALAIAHGGNGGNGGDSGVGATGGAGSSGGNGGRIQLFNAKAGTGSLTTGAVGTAGTAAVLTVGGTGGGGGTCSVTF